MRSKADVGWVVWVKPGQGIPIVGRWTGPRDWVSPYLDEGPAELSDCCSITAAVATAIGRHVWLVRVARLGQRWQVTAVRDDPRGPAARAVPALPAWVERQVTRRWHMHAKAITRLRAGRLGLAALWIHPRSRRFYFPE